MAASLITFANLGKKTNLPTADILPVIETFASKHELRQIICQINTGFYFKNTVSAVPWPVHYAIRIFETLFRTKLHRRTEEMLFDFFAQWKLAPARVVFFHGGYFLPRTLEKAKKTGAITIDILRTAHFQTNAQIEEEEIKKLNISTYDANYSGLLKTSGHANNFEYVIAMSEFAKDTYIKSGFPAEKLFTATPDIDTKRFSPTHEKKEKFRVLYMAHTSPIKGLHYLLDAWEQLSLPNAELVIVGGMTDVPEELRTRYMERITKRSDIFQLSGTTTPEAEYRKASVFVLPSLTEGFGRVTLEAMASGLPVVTTQNAKGLVEDSKSGFVVPIRDAQALKEKIDYLYQHQDVAEEMGREARKTVLNKKSFGESIFEIYQEILARENSNA